MTLPEVRRATADKDQDTAIQALVLGFGADPVFRWLWPSPRDYLATMPDFSRAFGGRAFEHDTAHLVEGGKAAALWLPPGAEVDGEEVGAVLARSLPEDRLADVMGVLEHMDEYHPDDPCWYLSMIAADPNWIGQGLGAALMKHALLAADEAGLPAYLESSNPRNVAFYERHGFEVLGEIQVGGSPVVRPMIRAPR
ncbi:MAG: GNAT family N-acetyltransferase [Pseudomonadota bacterium]